MTAIICDYKLFCVFHLYNIAGTLFDAQVTGVVALPNSSHFVTASADATVRLWDMAARTSLQTLTDHTEGHEVWGVTASRDGKRLASVADDGAVVVYSVQ